MHGTNVTNLYERMSGEMLRLFSAILFAVRDSIPVFSRLFVDTMFVFIYWNHSLRGKYYFEELREKVRKTKSRVYGNVKKQDFATFSRFRISIRSKGSEEI